MRYPLSFLCFFSFLSFTFSQRQIIVQHGNNATIYTDIDTAVAMAPAGAYVYLPGGFFDAGADGLLIDKELHIIGTGHYPDSTTATGLTKMNRTIFITTSGSNTTLEGFYCEDIRFGKDASNDAPQNIIINRVSVDIIYMGISDVLPNAKNILIKHSIIRRWISGFGAEQLILQNNIIGDVSTAIQNVSYASIEHNLIFGTNGGVSSVYYPLERIYHSVFKNNIFKNNNENVYSQVNDLTFYNNIFNYEPNLQNQISTNNLFNISPDSIFINQTNQGFTYDDDYHLKPNSPAIGTGFHGTDIGIYGGNEPYKEGAVPHNPHIQFQNINGATDTQGNLQIHIKVRAQDN